MYDAGALAPTPRSDFREPSARTTGSIDGVELDFDRCYRAVAGRDPRFDGWFVTAVTSTGIYCRPSCPAITPKRQNVRFYPSAAAAQRNGFRACRRCRPDAAPGSPEWDIRADVVGRAMRLIGDGVVDREGVPGLARRLGYTERHLHRMLRAELGAGPLALARAQRAQTARILIETTDLGLAEIAFAAGFGSVRQFNDTVREVYAAAPSDLRATAKSRNARGGESAGTIAVRLAYRRPLHAEALLEFLGARAIPGIDQVDGDGTYRRALRLPHGLGTTALTPRDGYVSAALRLADVRDLAPAVARCRRLLDLDADPAAVDGTLAEDVALAPLIAKDPGVRVPRAVDGFEIAVRAIVGQQISVPGARTVLAKLARLAGGSPVDREPVGGEPVDGEPIDGELAAFPSPAAVADAPDEAFAMPAARRRTIKTLAAAVAADMLDLDGGMERAEVERILTGIPGVGAWTASYVALRALGDPDAFLPNDLGVRRGAAALGLPDDPKTLTDRAARWRPWRGYAVIRLWRAG
jgi:AraC family transcriptional regulator of adaptative response / DNA-3-methyladenine glycosylase II